MASSTTSTTDILTLNKDESYSKLTNNASEIYSKLQDYNQAYTKYVLCLEQHPTYDATMTRIERDASSNYMYNSSQCVQPDATQLMNRIQQLQQEMNRMVMTTPGPDSDVPTKYNEVLKMRKEMDLKLRELYKLNTSVPVMYQQETDSTLYATLLWATLATCLVYYITML